MKNLIVWIAIFVFVSVIAGCTASPDTKERQKNKYDWVDKHR